jgi:hypothetical protein
VEGHDLRDQRVIHGPLAREWPGNAMASRSA